MITAHELGVADQIDLIRTRVALMEPAPDELVVDNPLGVIPTLVLDDGTSIFDSVVICEYLDHCYGAQTLFPPPSPARWNCLTRHTIANGALDALILLRNERQKPEGRSTPEWIDKFSSKVTQSLDRIETLINARTGAAPDIGDIACACFVGYLDFRFQEIGWRKGRPNLNFWFAAFSERPSMIATSVIDDS